jgi:hypothetical protein
MAGNKHISRDIEVPACCPWCGGEVELFNHKFVQWQAVVCKRFGHIVALVWQPPDEKDEEDEGVGD